MHQNLKLHLAATTGLLLAITPVYAVVEIFVLGMPADVSLLARILVAVIAFLGLGYAYATLRERSKHLFRVVDGISSNAAIVMHDLLFLIAFNAVLTPILYMIAGASFYEIIAGTGFALVMAVFNGPINGFFIDLAGDFTGLKPSARLPTKLAALNDKTKRVTFFALIGITVLALGLLYWARWEV